MDDPAKRGTIRITNLATFVSSVFGANGVGFFELNDHFIDTFTPEDEPLHKEPGQLYLDLKTQIFASGVAQSPPQENPAGSVQGEHSTPVEPSTRDELLEYLFPQDVEDILHSRHPETPLTPIELDFCVEFTTRREYLMNASIESITEKHIWEDFLLSLSAHLSSEYSALIVCKTNQYLIPIQDHCAGIDVQY